MDKEVKKEDEIVKEEKIAENESPKPQTKSKNKLLLLAVLFFLGLICLLVIIILAILLGRNNKPKVSNFEECAAAGNPVMESFPRQCSADGKTYVEDITPSETATPTPSVTTSPSVTTTPTTSSTSVKVFFSKDPSSYDDPTIVVAVNRTTSRTDVATFAVEQLLNGPTTTEETSGLFNPVALSGASNCGGNNFTVTVNSSTRKATIKFCKNIVTAGVLEDARIENVIEATLNQFTTIDSVAILDKNGDCFGDNSGLNLCL